MSSLITIFLSLALLSQCQADLIGDICAKANNPSLCTQTLRSDPRSSGANARTLAGIALEKAVSATQASVSVAKSLSNPKIKAKIDTCIEVFGDAIDTLQECKPLLPRADPVSKSDLQTKGSAALTDVDTCSDDFGSDEPAQLKQASAKAYTLVEVFLIIVNTL